MNQSILLNSIVEEIIKRYRNQKKSKNSKITPDNYFHPVQVMNIGLEGLGVPTIKDVEFEEVGVRTGTGYYPFHNRDIVVKLSNGDILRSKESFGDTYKWRKYRNKE